MRNASFLRSSLWRPRRHEPDHLNRLRVVADHALHELDVVAGVLHLGEIGGLLGGDDLARLTGRAGLNDRRLRLDDTWCGFGALCRRGSARAGRSEKQEGDKGCERTNHDQPRIPRTFP